LRGYLGAAVVRALRYFGIPVLRFSWGIIGVFLVLAVIVGLVAAIIPAVRAARTTCCGRSLTSRFRDPG